MPLALALPEGGYYQFIINAGTRTAAIALGVEGHKLCAG